MPALPCSGSFDLDEIFSYNTARFVRIRDRRLGLLKVSFMVGIVGYIIGGAVLAEKGYMVFGDITPLARLTMQAPVAAVREPRENIPYCLPDDSPCNVTDTGAEFATCPCRYLDGRDAVFPEVEQSGIFLTTRITETFEVAPNTPECATLGNVQCNYTIVNSTTYYVAQPELFTVGIFHTLSVPGFALFRPSFSMKGRLLDADGDPVNPCAAFSNPATCSKIPTTIGVENANDIVPVDVLLQAAGIASLDDILDVPRTPGESAETMRNSGLVIMLQIEYDNTFSFDQNKYQYDIRVLQVEGTDFKGEQVIPVNPQDGLLQRVVRNRHGVRIVVTQAGTVGEFRFQQLLIQLVTSLGLLAVASTVVDLIALNFCPLRHIYGQYKTVTSVDFSEVQNLPQSVVLRFRNEDLINPRPAVFNEVVNHSSGDGASGVAIGRSGAAAHVTSRDSFAGGKMVQMGFFGAVPADATVVRNPLDPT